MSTSTPASTSVRPMVSFHGRHDVKEAFLARVRAHRAADEIIQGSYWDGHRGCAVGCTIHGDNHLRYEEALGIPQALAYLEDRIHEGIPLADALAWPERFLVAIPVGADLAQVADRLMLWLLSDEGYNLAQFAVRDGKAVIATVHALYVRKLAGETIAIGDWATARKAASYAAAYAAAAAADASYAAAADAAAYASYASYAPYAARLEAKHAAWDRIADHLVMLLEQAPIVAELAVR